MNLVSVPFRGFPFQTNLEVTIEEFESSGLSPLSGFSFPNLAETEPSQVPECGVSVPFRGFPFQTSCQAFPGREVPRCLSPLSGFSFPNPVPASPVFMRAAEPLCVAKIILHCFALFGKQKMPKSPVKSGIVAKQPNSSLSINCSATGSSAPKTSFTSRISPWSAASYRPSPCCS